MEFKKLSEVQLVEGAVDTANVLIEENGEIKRVPKTEVGGTGFPTVIIESGEYMQYVENAHNGTQEPSVSPAELDVNYSFSGLTFEEAYEELYNGGIINVIFKLFIDDYPSIIPGTAIFTGITLGLPCIVLTCIFLNPGDGSIGEYYLFWTEDGISEQFSEGVS